MLPDVIGKVVVSRAGRDKGKYFVVVAIDDDAHVLIADGGARKAVRAKRKKLKHLHFTSYKVSEDGLKMHSERGTVDAYLRGSLELMFDNKGIPKEEQLV